MESDIQGAPSVSAARIKAIRADVTSLTDYEAHLSSKVQFLLDATLGFINIEQNEIVKTLTVASVVGVPPVFLVVGIYGMNFRVMPELGWSFGYPMALGLIVVSTLIPPRGGSSAGAGCSSRAPVRVVLWGSLRRSGTASRRSASSSPSPEARHDARQPRHPARRATGDRADLPPAPLDLLRPRVQGDPPDGHEAPFVHGALLFSTRRPRSPPPAIGPCFECRRRAALDFQSAWVKALGPPAMADDMDRVLSVDRPGSAGAGR